MTETSPTVSHYRSLFEEAAGRLPGADNSWVAEQRRAAMSRFAELGFPGPRSEEWKYTDLRPLEKRQFLLPEQPGQVTAADVAPYLFEEPAAHRLVFVDGTYAPHLSEPIGLPAGVTVQPMSEALEAPDENLTRHLGSYADPEGTPFVALNTALMSDGVFVHVPSGIELETPIHLLFVSSGAVGEATANYRNLVIAEEGASVTVVEDFMGLGEEASFTNAVTEAVAADRARVEICKLQEETGSAYHIAAFAGQQGTDSQMVHHNIALGGRLVRNDLVDVLDAEGAYVSLNGLYLGDKRQHMDTHSRIDHLKPSSVSREYYKGILDGHARGVFNGKVVVYPEAQGTDSDQQNRNLLLSRDAEVDPKPELEIFADDVACTHGATVGQLDDNALFFLRSRGLSQQEARNLLIFGFANEVIERLGIEPLRARLEERLLHRLPHTAAMED